MTDDRDSHLRLASSRPMSVLPGGLDGSQDPGDEPLTEGTPRPALTSISVHRSGSTVTATATLALAGKVLTGAATREDADRDRAITEATLAALRPLLPKGVGIESAQVVNLPARRVAVAVVVFPAAAEASQVLVGSALVRGDAEDALARCVLSALNRRISR